MYGSMKVCMYRKYRGVEVLRHGSMDLWRCLDMEGLKYKDMEV